MEARFAENTPTFTPPEQKSIVAQRVEEIEKAEGRILAGLKSLEKKLAPVLQLAVEQPQREDEPVAEEPLMVKILNDRLRALEKIESKLRDIIDRIVL